MNAASAEGAHPRSPAGAGGVVRKGQKLRLGWIVVTVLSLWVGVAWYREEMGQRLIDAAWNDRTAAAERLLVFGANPQAVRDRKDRFRGLPKLLIEWVAPREQTNGYTPLLIVAGGESDNAQLAEALIRHGAPVNGRGWVGMTPLGNASRERNKRICKVLLKHGAQVNQSGFQGEPPLVAVCWGEGFNPGPNGPLMPLVRLLSEAGANVDASDQRGRTALMGAAHHGDAQAVQYLLQRGADPAVEDRSGNTALEYAEESGNIETARLLRSHEAQSSRLPARAEAR